MVKRVTIELISEAVGETFRRLLGNPIALALFIALVAWLSYYARRRRA